MNERSIAVCMDKIFVGLNLSGTGREPGVSGLCIFEAKNTGLKSRHYIA